MNTVLVTHVEQYAGPGIAEVLIREGYRVLCHDHSFADADRRRAYEKQRPGVTALKALKPDEIFAEASAMAEIEGFVFNNVLPYRPENIEDVAIDTLRAAFDALLVFPFRLSQLFLPPLKARRRGSLVFITSARQLQPEPGFAVPTSIRAATTTFALALAREAAPYQIQVNAVAPNYLLSEMYYPKAQFVDDPIGRAIIAEKVPFGRLGKPVEIGELVAFLVSGRSPFTTGQMINFTGGWP